MFKGHRGVLSLFSKVAKKIRNAEMPLTQTVELKLKRIEYLL